MKASIEAAVNGPVEGLDNDEDNTAIVFYNRLYRGLDWSGAFREDFYSSDAAGYGPVARVRPRVGEDWVLLAISIVKTSVCWMNRAKWKENVHLWALHFPALSTNHPGLLSYYQSEEKRGRDIRTPIKPGKYLKKFFGDVLSEEEIQEWAIEWSTWATPPVLTVTQDADEIERVYVDGPNSCMSKPVECFDSFCHPVRVYAGPDLALAYATDPSNPEKIVGRAIVWPEKMIHSRVYGDIHRTEAALRAAGYSEGDLDGAHVLRIYDEKAKSVVLPYVDGISWAGLDDSGEFLVLGQGDIDCDITMGIPQWEECYECGSHLCPAELLVGPNTQSYCASCHEECFGCREVVEEDVQSGPGIIPTVSEVDQLADRVSLYLAFDEAA